MQDISSPDFLNKNVRINPDLQESMEDGSIAFTEAVTHVNGEAELIADRKRLKQEAEDHYHMNKKKHYRYR